jgi:hypothetical protein
MTRAVVCGIAILLSGTSFAGDPGDHSLCYETIGCVHDRKVAESEIEALGCEQLWTVRNGIFHSRGYCFKTDRAKEAFGNEGCEYEDESAVPLNDYERANVKSIRDAEALRGC